MSLQILADEIAQRASGWVSGSAFAVAVRLGGGFELVDDVIVCSEPIGASLTHWAPMLMR
jgi:hypothetical protein